MQETEQWRERLPPLFCYLKIFKNSFIQITRVNTFGNSKQESPEGLGQLSQTRQVAPRANFNSSSPILPT